MTAVAPGVTVTTEAERTPRGVESRTGTLFAVGITERGPSDGAVKVTSASTFKRHLGRAAFDTLTTPIRTFFGEGGGAAWIARVVGPAATFASVDITESTIVVGTLTAKEVGGWADGVTVDIDASAGTATVTWGDVEEVFRNITDADSLAAALEGSGIVGFVAVEGGTALTTQTHTLAGGDDDRANITDAEWTAAIDNFARDMGPGQVAAPGRSNATVHQALLDHAEAYNRFAYLDAPVDAVKADLTALGESFNTSYGALFGNWVKIPGHDGRQRDAPGSAYAAGVTARRDSATPTAHEAPAGNRGFAQFAVDVVQQFPNKDDVAELNGAGVNLIRANRDLGVQLYGFRSLSNDDAWVQATAGRYRMSLSDRAEQIAERFLFRPLNPAVISDFGNALNALLLGDYQLGALYGETPEEAFSVDVSDDVNPAEDISAGLLQAVMAAKFVPFGERVLIRIIKVAVSGTV